ncbi:hypothetical protein ACJX0J_025730, partial [Zea mays]
MKAFVYNDEVTSKLLMPHLFLATSWILDATSELQRKRMELLIYARTTCYDAFLEIIVFVIFLYTEEELGQIEDTPEN